MRASLYTAAFALLATFATMVRAEEKPFVTWNHPPAVTNSFARHLTYRSEVMQTEVGYNLYLPPGYNAPGNTNRYPVIYWLHGKGGNENGDAKYAASLDAAISSGKIPPLIHVWVCGGEETYYSDSFDGKWMSETTIIKELVPHIDTTCRTLAKRDQRAIQGMSMGGFGAMRLGLKYPELFSSIVAWAGGYRDPELMKEKMVQLNYEKMFNNDPVIFMAGHPFTTAVKNADRVRGKTGIMMICGTKDYLLVPNRRMDDILTKAGLAHQYEEVPDIDHNGGKYAAWLGTRGWEFAASHFGAK